MVKENADVLQLLCLRRIKGFISDLGVGSQCLQQILMKLSQVDTLALW